MEHEFLQFERDKLWKDVFTLINSESDMCMLSKDTATAHHSLNRYIDVTPYDVSRVKLRRTNNDYINASHIMVREASRHYILTQGPLDNTISHFWLMIWEQNSRAVVMLNRLIENAVDKCHQYWPEGAQSVLTLADVQLVVKHKSTRNCQHYIHREFVLIDEESREQRTIQQFHFTGWPDFGQPDSPLSFLKLHNAVKNSGGLDKYGPAVIHCSAGIGRSGTFCLIDCVLVMIEKQGSTSGIDIRSILVNMRKYRMGLIQSPDQLRFSYIAILTASDLLKSPSSSSTGDQLPGLAPSVLAVASLDNEDVTSPLIKDVKNRVDSENHLSNQTMASSTAGSTVLLQRRRERDLRNQRIANKTRNIKETMRELEAKRNQWRFLTTAKVAFATCGVAVLMCLYYYTHGANR